MVRLIPSTRRMRLLLVAGVLLVASVIAAVIVVPKVVSSDAKGGTAVCFRTPEGAVIKAESRNVLQEPGIQTVRVLSGDKLTDEYVTYDTAGMNEVSISGLSFAGAYKGYMIDKPGVNDPNQPGARDVSLLATDVHGQVTAKIITVHLTYGQNENKLAQVTDGRIKKGGLQLQPC